MSQRVAIVGAGPAGTAVAYGLRETDAEVTVFERDSDVCGRAATRRRNGCVYDHGANYVKSADERVNGVVDDLGADGLVDVRDPVWTFDGDGTVSEGRDADDRKWSYRNGIADLGRRLLARSGATVEFETEVIAIERWHDEWRLRGTGGTDGWEVLVLTPPAPPTASLLDGADWDHDLRADLRDAADAVPYRTVVTVVLHYPFPIDRPYYALVNVDGDHEVGWLSREACKPGHVPEGESLLVVQLSPEWSADHYAETLPSKVEVAATHAAELLDDDRLTSPDWADETRWRHALPDAGADGETLSRASKHGLFFAGDWVVGEGRVHAALASGLEAAERVADR